MRNYITISISLFLLTGCPKTSEIKQMANDLSEKNQLAQELIIAGDFSTDKLLEIHDYFFDFAEKVHLLLVETEAAASVQKMIKKKGAQEFCSAFFMPKDIWAKLNHYCETSDYYACSFEMKDYTFIVSQLKKTFGTEYEEKLNSTPECFN